MPDSQVFEEIGRRDFDTAWTTAEGREALSVKCIVCKAPVDRKCKNPVTGATRKVWCIGRVERSTPQRTEQR